MIGLAGINIGGATGTDAIQPAMYPNIVESIPYALNGIERVLITEMLAHYTCTRAAGPANL